MKPNHIERTARFRDSEKLNAILGELSSLLTPIQHNLHFDAPLAPVGCIVGNPRSGTSLFQQWLASLGAFSYPTNLLTRFAYAPYIGTLIQKILFDPDYDFHGDFEDIQSRVNFSSDLGKRKGALACNEFQHFFRNYMPNFDLEWLDSLALQQTDCRGMEKGLASIEAGFGKPFITKACILQFNIAHFAKHIPSLFWLHIVRDPLFTMQSILLARERYYGNGHIWWSAKPKEYAELKNMDIYHQIAGQVYFTDMAIRYAMENLSDKRGMTVQYESFCEEPATVYSTLCEKYAALGYELPAEYKGSVSFEARNKIKLPSSDIDALQSAYDEFDLNP